MNIHEHQAKEILKKYLEEFKKYTRKEILEQRKDKFLSIGKRKAFTSFSKESVWVPKDNFFIFIKYLYLV